MAQRTLETGTEDLLAHIEDGIAVVTMNRPERRNALSADMLGAMAKTFAEIEVDPEVKCLVLTGAGKGFCAGGDVKGMAESYASGAAPKTLDERIHAQRISQRSTAGKLFKMPKPTIAALPGAAAGAGLSIALACDLRVMADNAVMTTAFARVGFSGDYGGTYFMTQLIGAAKARELYMLSDRVSAEEAVRLGLANKAVPADQLMDETMTMARRLASGATIAYRYMKENLNRAMSGADVDDCLDLEATHHIHTGLTEDHREAAQAFVDKREPQFKGR